LNGWYKNDNHFFAAYTIRTHCNVLLCFGVAAILYKVATPYADPISLVLAVYLFAIIFTALAWYFSPNKFIAKDGLKWMALAAGFAFIGMIRFIYALKIGQASIVVPVRNLALAVTVILAVVLLGEELSLTKTTNT
jgi:uncharacterized membrane protein